MPSSIQAVGVNVPNTKAFEDYGTATSTPSNKEVLLAYRLDEGGSKFFKFYNPTRYSGNERYLTDNYGMLSNFLVNYYRADGSDQSVARPLVLETRFLMQITTVRCRPWSPAFKSDNYAHGIDSWNNPGEFAWSYCSAAAAKNHEGRGKGAAQSTKVLL